MSTIEIILIGVGLAMDAFAVAVCKGLSIKKIDVKKELIVGSYFGLFQGLMPLLGFLLGTTFQDIIIKIDHWVAFLLLSVIGSNMIKDSFSKESENINDKVDFKTMFPLAIATSVDALAVGITFAFLKVNIVLASSVIAITTLLLSILGVKIGNKFGNKYEKKAEFVGGAILILIGLKILIEHTSGL